MSRRPLASSRPGTAVRERPRRTRHLSERTTRTSGVTPTSHVQTRGRSRIFLILTVAVGAAVLVAALTLAGRWLLHQPYFDVQHVTLAGEVHESPSQILTSTHLSDHPAMIDVTRATLQRQLSMYPWIASVSLIKRWPNSVQVTVHEVAAVAVAYDPRHVLRYVSAQGRNLSLAPVTANLPTLMTTPLTLAARSWPYQGAVVAGAVVASQLPSAFASQVRRVIVDQRGNVTLQMTSPIEFFLGPASNLDAKFVAVASAIAHATFAAGDVVDVTTPSELSVTGPSPS